MSALEENVWADVLNEDRNIWANSNLENNDISNPENFIINDHGKIVSNDTESIHKNEEDNSDKSIGISNDDCEKADDNICNNPPTNSSSDAKNRESQKGDITDQTSEDKTNKIQETKIPIEETQKKITEKNDDFDEDFGEFEEIPTTKLEFGRPIESILKDVISENIENEGEVLGGYDKSIFLVESGNKAMKCHNILMADDRQFSTRELPTINTRRRGCVEQLIIYKEMVKITNDWVFDEKGMTKNICKDDENIFGKNNIFRWSTKLSLDDEEKENTNGRNFLNERKLIGQKLLTAAYQEARKIIDEKIEAERREKLTMDKMKWEREQRIKKQKESREEEMSRYKTANPDLDSTRKKKGFFGKIFNSKSKIAKDNISHKKIIKDAGDQINDNTRDLSLKEQMELDGYELGSSKKSKHKSKKRKDNDEDDNDNDSDDTMFEGDISGYNILDPNIEVPQEGFGSVFDEKEEDNNDGKDDQHTKTVNVSTSETLSTLHKYTDSRSNTADNNDFRSFENCTTVDSSREQNIGITNSHKSVNESSDSNSFEDFQTHTTPTTGTSPQEEPKSIGNLIDL